MKSIPRLDQHKKERLSAIRGTVPSLKQLPSGCRFHPRCPYAVGRCAEEQPELTPAGNGHRVRCWMTGDTEQIFVNRAVEVTG
ncbi:putative D,D-dipeptide transport ATP-binding protein DdpD [compost metagenome]